jgi:hypothetical protein
VSACSSDRTAPPVGRDQVVPADRAEPSAAPVVHARGHSFGVLFEGLHGVEVPEAAAEFPGAAQQDGSGVVLAAVPSSGRCCRVHVGGRKVRRAARRGCAAPRGGPGKAAWTGPSGSRRRCGPEPGGRLLHASVASRGKGAGARRAAVSVRSGRGSACAVTHVVHTSRALPATGTRSRNADVASPAARRCLRPLVKEKCPG